MKTRLRSEQKSSYLLRELLSHFSQLKNLDVSAGTFPAAVPCFTTPRHGLSAGCEADLEYSFVAREAVVRLFTKAILDAGADFELSGKAA